MSIRRAYGGDFGVVRHPLPGVAVVGGALLVACSCWPVSPGSLVAIVAGVAVVAGVADRWWWRPALVLGLLAMAAHTRADAAWADLHPVQLGEFSGWAQLIGDPQPLASASRVVLEIDGQRFEYWARSRAKQTRVSEWQAGDRIVVSGERNPLDPSRQLRVASQHVVGRFELEWAGDRMQGGPLARSANAVRDALGRGARVLPEADAALFTGLVVGDDRRQPAAMVDRFRASGLSHLTAVSGQNVAFLLAAAGPLLRRLRPGARWASTLILIAWFAALCRFEPSILRAGVMAGLSATAFGLGSERSPARLLWLAVIGLLLVDPLLGRSVGFWLSVGATAGVTVVGPPLARRLRVLGPLATPVGITLGAQAGVAIPALLTFGTLPLVSLPANLLAVPVAGAVMLYGLPAGLLSGIVPPVAPVLMFPCRVGVRWVDTVALLGERLEPGGTATTAGWLITIGVLGAAIVAVPASRVPGVAGNGKNRGPDERAPADRRRRVAAALEGARSDQPPGR